MSLKVWLPLNNLKNIGLENVSVTNNGATLEEYGPFNKCYSFDGNDDYISLNGQCLYDIIKGGDVPFSICFWVYHADSTRGVIFGDYNLTGAINFNIELTTAHKLRLYWNASPDYTTVNAVCELNTWAHVAIVYTTEYIYIYKNGSLLANRYGTLSSKNKTSGSYYLGRDSRTGSTYAFKGKISDFRIYHSPLTAEDIKRIYRRDTLDILANKYNGGFFYDRSGFFVNKLTSTDLRISGSSLYFNNTTASIRPEDGTSGFEISGGTLSIWFKVASKPTSNQILFIDTVSQMSIGFYSSGNYFLTTCNGSNYASFSAANVKYNNQLNNVIVTFNESKAPVSCFVNGSAVTQNGTSTKWTETAGKGMTVGRRMYNTSSNFVGYINKVTLYRKQLDNDEKQHIYLSEKDIFDVDVPAPIQNDNYLTFQAKQAGSTVRLIKWSEDPENIDVNLSIEYSLDGGQSWNTYTFENYTGYYSSGTLITLNSLNDTVKFRGTNSSFCTGENGTDSLTQYTQFVLSGIIEGKGNVVSLINNTGDSGASIPDYCFSELFSDCTSLTKAPNINAASVGNFACVNMFFECTNLVSPPQSLPATSLGIGCYMNMFESCTSLSSVPNLPATSLAASCYTEMFTNCSSLSNLPQNLLPATTMKNCCYRLMFNNCTGITKAPNIPATTTANRCFDSMFRCCYSLTGAPSSLPATLLTSYCYYSMFDGCRNLVAAPNLPATTLNTYCYEYMFRGCSALTNVQAELPATALRNYCYAYMFQNCKSLTSSPRLPATTLVSYCYRNMFQNCSNLSYITAMFTTTPSNSYTINWVSGVKSTGTFVKNHAATWNVVGANGVPTNWTIITDEDVAINYDNTLNKYHLVVDDLDDDRIGTTMTTEEYIVSYLNNPDPENIYTCVGTFTYDTVLYYIWECTMSTGNHFYVLTENYTSLYELSIAYNHNNRNCVSYFLGLDWDEAYACNDSSNVSLYLIFDYYVDE